METALMETASQPGAMCVHFLEAARQYRYENNYLTGNQSPVTTSEHTASNIRSYWIGQAGLATRRRHIY